MRVRHPFEYIIIQTFWRFLHRDNFNIGISPLDNKEHVYARVYYNII